MEENNNGQNNMNENMQPNEQNNVNQNAQQATQNNSNSNMQQNVNNNYSGQTQGAFNNADVKRQAKEATGFFSAFFKDPLTEVEKISKNPSNKYLKIAIIVLVIWLVIIFASNVFSTASVYLFGVLGSFSNFFEHFFSKFLDVLKELIAPICSIAILAALAYGFSKEKKKSFMHVASSITIAKIPVVIAEIVSLLTLISANISTFTVPFAGFCNVLSTILLFFTIKDIVGEKENKKIFWKFALIIGIYYAIEIVLSFLKIYI